jgi:hypothetical protein
MSEYAGTFLVVESDDDSAVLRNVESGQVHTLDENPDLAVDEVVEGTVAPVPPMDVVWELHTVEDRWTVDVIDSDLSPTKQARDVAEGLAPGDLEKLERAGTGEVHVLAVGDDVDAAAEDVLADDATVARAARLGAVRVEVRRGEDFLNVRYLPD